MKMHCTRGEMNCVWISFLMAVLFSWLFNLSHGLKASLVFIKEPENVIAVTGKKVSFSCSASATGKEIAYFWKLNGSFLNEDNTSGFKMSKGLLQINNINGAEHRGAYECIAFTKDLGSIKSRKAYLKIAYFSGKSNLKRFERPMFPLPFFVKAPKYKALPTPTFLWQYYKELESGRHLYLNISDFKEIYLTSKGNLMIPVFKPTQGPFFRVYMYHPAVNDGLSPALFEKIALRRFPGSMNRCPDSSMTSFPTVTNKTVPEGSIVFFECYIVAKSCNYNISISWIKAGRILNETSRRLVLKNVTKMGHEGTYKCHGKLSRYATSITITYNLTVLEKPKLVKAVKPTVSLPANGILHPAVFKNTASLKWYKDGSVIDKTSILFDVFPNGNLKMKYPSPEFNGIYQMVFENLAGTKIVSQTVTVNSKAPCVKKIYEMSGSISYNQATPAWDDITCIWLFELPSAKQMQFKITTFKFYNPSQAKLSVFEGSAGTKSSIAKYLFSVASVNGPFISMVFNTKAYNVGSFTVEYWPKSDGPATTVSIKTSKMKPTTGTPTTGKPTNSKPKVNKPTTNKPTVMKSTMKSTKQDPVKAKQTGCKVCPNTGAIVGGIFGALILIALIVLIIYREKVLQKCGYSRSANVKAAETTSTPMFEVDTSEKTC